VHDSRGVDTKLVRGQQDARTEALDLQSSRGLRVEAVPEPARRQDREREHHEHGDAREHAQRTQRAAATCDLPDVDGSDRDDDQRVELRRHREPEQAEPEELAATQDCRERSDRERRGKQVIGVQRDRPDRDRRQGEERRGGVEAPPGRAQRHEREQDGEERPDPAQRHQSLEAGVVRAPGQNSRRHENQERSGRVLDEDVTVREVSA